jgi:vacuolar-type H+-ATPase subunit E/Vma4
VSSLEAIKKLETSNQHLQTIIEHLDEQLNDIRSDPRLHDLVDDLEKLFYAYLKTWIKSNTEVIEILSKNTE